MSDDAAAEAARRLQPFIGEWGIEPQFDGASPAEAIGRTVFEWMSGERFIVQRWELSHPAAPDGVAIIGFNGGRQAYLQHYFDARGVARVYEMSFEDGTWKLWRNRRTSRHSTSRSAFTGTFSADGTTITGTWETSKDGSTWERDFDLTYKKVPSSAP